MKNTLNNEFHTDGNSAALYSAPLPLVQIKIKGAKLIDFDLY